MTADIRRALLHAVTAFDRKQEERAARNPRAYHNAHALAQYLARVDDVLADIEAGATPTDAIVAGFSPGALRNACLKAIGGKSDNREAHDSYLGLPTYRPARRNQRSLQPRPLPARLRRLI